MDTARRSICRHGPPLFGGSRRGADGNYWTESRFIFGRAWFGWPWPAVRPQHPRLRRATPCHSAGERSRTLRYGRRACGRVRVAGALWPSPVAPARGGRAVQASTAGTRLALCAVKTFAVLDGGAADRAWALVDLVWRFCTPQGVSFG